MAGIRELVNGRKWGQIEQAIGRGEQIGDAREIITQLLYVIYRTVGAEPSVGIIDTEYLPMTDGRQPENRELKQVRDVMKAY